MIDECLNLVETLNKTIMPTLTTKISATHTNAIELDAIFITDNSRAPIYNVLVKLMQDGQEVDHFHVELTPNKLSERIDHPGAIDVHGDFHMVKNGRAIYFKGSINYQNHVRVNGDPAVIAVW